MDLSPVLWWFQNRVEQHRPHFESFLIPCRNERLLKKEEEAGGRRRKEKSPSVSDLLEIITDNGAILYVCVYYVSAFLWQMSARIILGYLGECPHPHLANKCPAHTLSTQFKGYQLRKLVVIGSCRSHRYWQQAESLYTNSDVWLSYLWDRQAYKCFSMGWSRSKWVHKSLMWDESKITDCWLILRF